MYRWNVFDTYDASTGFLFNDNATLFGGVHPSSWSGNATAADMTSNADVLQSLLTQKGYPGRNAMVLSDTRIQYGLTDGKVVVVLFRVQNTTAAPIDWTPHFWYSCNRQSRGAASIALNGVNAFVDCVVGAANMATSGSLANVTLSIPANHTSTVVFVSTSGTALSLGNVQFFQPTVAGFVDDSLALPAGLSFVDDLDTMSAAPPAPAF